MTVPSFIGPTAYQWDDLWLGGVKFPGIARVTGSGIQRKLDVQRKKGAAGAKLKDEGDDPGTGTIELRMWTTAQFEEYQRLLPDINPRKRGGTKFVLDVFHPVLNLANINRIYMKGLPLVDHDKRMGTITARMEFLEWFPEPVPQKPPPGGGTSVKEDEWEYVPGPRQFTETVYDPRNVDGNLDV